MHYNIGVLTKFAVNVSDTAPLHAIHLLVVKVIASLCQMNMIILFLECDWVCPSASKGWAATSGWIAKDATPEWSSGKDPRLLHFGG